MFNKTEPAKSSDTQKKPLMPTESNNGTDKNNKIILYSQESNFSHHNINNSVAEKFKQLSLRTKATIIAIAIGTIPVLGFGILSYSIASKSIENKFTQSQQSETEGLADKVSRFMVERYSNVQVLANLPIFANRRIRESLSPQEKQVVLDKIAETSKVYDSIAVVDLDGNVIVQSKGSVIPSNIGDRDYIKAVKRDDRPYISQPQLSPSSNKLSIYTVSPVKDNVSNETVAILRARMPVESLESVIKNYGGAGRKYSLADVTGKVFVASKKDQVGKNINTQKLGGDEVVSSASTTTVQGLPDLKWKAVLATNKATAFDAQRQLLLTTVIGTGLTALLVAMLAYLLAKRATEPILNATAAVARLGEGELDTRLEVERGDELGVLGANINQMAEQMQALLQKQQLDAERAKLLAEITLKIRQTLQYDEITKTAVREIRQALLADRVVFYQFNPQTFEGTIVSESVVAGYPKMTGVEIDDPCFRERHAETYKDGRVRVIYNIYNDPSLKNAACYIKMLEKFVVKANLIAPVIKQKQLIGLLIAHQCDGPRQWQASDIEFFKQLAIQIGYAVEQAQLLETVEKGKMVAEKSTEDERHQKEALQMQLLELLSEVEGAASGDLTVRADVTAGEIGTVADFFNSIVESLREIVTQVQQTAIKVNDSINVNSGAINELADEALEQAAEINRTLSAVDSMTRDMQAVAQNAQKAAYVTNTARNTATKSGMAMDMTVQNILSLRETVGETAKKVKRLGESTQQISRVVALINQISMQTNLLAINAGIEAARAGEEGQGFIVVAEEVGELAARSAAATKEIEQIVENIQRETSEVVQAMELGTTQVVEGTHIVEDAKSSLNQILEVSRQIDALVQSISNATASQLETSSTVSELMKQIAASSQRTSTSSRQVSQSLQQTVAISEQLQSTVGTFKVN
ncbi:methyl-accepting chemotaxis protein [Dulcicalothrix desertica PCC 7102]|uniref:Methyl-accepting chemotaxis protein n=1 Tax=Dulcicalothrix desertica PCC 7102 TaxID=232991 RepID=A0A433V9V2_9CYAN|nr:methyl-accepting chemotaxis protein [Dulcicalothrix desertica]RUT02881.1 methyl-accepting chemotaxis protein [Dulcicalothrix desertica PCC 7102]TWH38888.1 methyl-accepting chemotaxis sensory transducer with GAF sensor [Dulcicalothrix desertica PCC 7102]